MASIVDLIDKIPATFWGVLAGSFFTVLAVILSNRAHDRRLKLQLQHDRELKARERELSLRKDIYLSATEAVSVGMNLVARIADLNAPLQQLLENFSEKAPAIAKAHLIAREDTAEALAKFNAELGSSVFRLLPKRLRLVSEIQSAQLMMDGVARHSQERDRMLELLKELNLSGVADERRRAVVDANFNSNQGRVQELLAQHAAFTADLLPRQLEFTRECQGEVSALSQLLIPLIASVRNELELPFNSVAYERITREAQAKLAASLEEFIRNATPRGKDA